jgi:phage tail-like protein
MANPGKRKEAFPAFHFEVDIDGTAYPFRSVSGLKSETKTVDVEEGGVNTHVHKLIGQTSFPPLVLRLGFCDPASPLYALYIAFLRDQEEQTARKRFNGFVRQLGPNGTSAKWIFQQGFISKWEGPELDASKNEVSIESIEITHEGLYLIGSGGGTGPTDKGGHSHAGLSFGSGLLKKII